MMNNTTTTRKDIANSPLDGGQSLEPFLFNVSQAIALLGIGKTRLYEEMKAGRLLYVTSGSRRLFPRADLEAYVVLLRREANRREPLCCAFAGAA